MAKEERYFTEHDVHMRWNNGLAKYNGRWYYVEASGMCLLLRELDKSNVVGSIDPNDEKLEVTTPELGYMNWDDHGATFISRASYRRQKQAAASDNLLYEMIYGASGGLPNNGIRCKAFKDMLENVYPSYSTAIGFINSRATSLAFSRDFAVEFLKKENVHRLRYKGRSVISTKRTEDQVWILDKGYNNSIIIQALIALSVPIQT